MFQGDSKLRRKGEQINYSQDMINEIIKCKEDIIYFAENYFYIVHPDRGKIKIKLFEWQKKVLKACVETPGGKKHLISMVPRQQGKCVYSDVKIKIRNKKTKEIKEMSIEKFYNLFIKK